MNLILSAVVFLFVFAHCWCHHTSQCGTLVCHSYLTDSLSSPSSCHSWNTTLTNTSTFQVWTILTTPLSMLCFFSYQLLSHNACRSKNCFLKPGLTRSCSYLKTTQKQSPVPLKPLHNLAASILGKSNCLPHPPGLFSPLVCHFSGLCFVLPGITCLLTVGSRTDSSYKLTAKLASPCMVVSLSDPLPAMTPFHPRQSVL